MFFFFYWAWAFRSLARNSSSTLTKPSGPSNLAAAFGYVETRSGRRRYRREAGGSSREDLRTVVERRCRLQVDRGAPTVFGRRG